MSTCPTINIAMFGSRSTGKTTFLTSFVGVTPEQGCSLGVSNEDTKRYLRDGWQRLQNGDVPPATPMGIKEKLLFRLCYQVKGCQQDELSWNIKINDYPGKLVEWDNPSDTSSFGNAWENENQETLSIKFKEELKKHIQNADAILFLAPIDIQTWSSSDQRLYMAYINDIIHIAKETRDNYSRSIPFCLALMKWDMTGIKAPTARISMDSDYIVAPQVEAYLKQNPVFQKIHSVIDNLNNDRVAVFAASAFGGHLSNDNTKPDPEHLEPYNILPILFWMCSKVEQNRLIIMNREIERISLLPDCHEKFEQIAKTYQTALEQGINDRTIIKEIEQKLQENKDKHIEFAENEVSKAFNVVEQDKRCWNPWKEKRDILKKQLRSGLYKSESKRELEHDIADLTVKARKTDLWIGFCYTCLFGFILLGVGAGIYGAGVSKHLSAITQAELVLSKDDNNVTSKDIDAVNDILDKNESFWFEDSLPMIKGKRESLQNRITKIISARKQAVDSIKTKYAIKPTDTSKEKLDKRKNCLDELKALPENLYSSNTLSLCGIDIHSMENEYQDYKIETDLVEYNVADSDAPEQKKFKLESAIKRIDAIPKTIDKTIIEKYRGKREGYAQQLATVTQSIKRTKDAHDFENLVNDLKGKPVESILIDIAKCPYTSETSADLFSQLTSMRVDAEKQLGDKLQQKMGPLQEQESSLKAWEFAKQISIKKQIYELYAKFSGYYPEGSETQTNYVKQANKLNEEIASLEQYTPIEEDYTLITSSPETEQLIKADGFLKKYQLEKYPKASGVISELNKTVEDLKNSFTQDFRQAMEENRANLQFDSYEFSKIVEFKKAEKAVYERFIKVIDCFLD